MNAPASHPLPGPAATVSREDVLRVAELSSLQLRPDEVPAIARDLNGILAYVAQLAEVDTTGVEPMAQVGDVLGDSAVALHGETLRADTVRTSTDRRAVMAEAPETDGRFFKVPKVIER